MKSKFLQVTNTIRIVILNIVFFICFFGIIGSCIMTSFFSTLVGEAKKNPNAKVLVLNPKGNLFEDAAWCNSNTFLNLPETPQTFFFDLTEALRLSVHDKKIDTILLDLSGLYSISLAQSEELHSLLEKNRENGKKIIAFNYGYDQASYFLASNADIICMEERGEFRIDGIALKTFFYGETFDKFHIKANVFKAGDCKSGAEPYMGTQFTDPSRNDLQKTSNAMWKVWLSTVGENRGLKAPYSELTNYMNQYVQLLQSERGKNQNALAPKNLFASVAFNAKMVDRLIALPYAAEIPELLEKLSLSSEYIEFDDYLATHRYSASNKIVVITLEGSISELEYPMQGYIIPSQVTDKINDAFENKSVRGIVLRVNSPGGSATASEAIREIIEKNLADHPKPFAVSFGDMAASGGYWISQLSKPIFANRASLTGSIGVYGILPDFSEAISHYLGLHIDGVQVGPGRTAVGTEPLSSRDRALVQASIDYTYDQFKQLVMTSRKIAAKDLLTHIGGRVYLGEEAQSIHFVDELGGLYDAIKKVAEEANIRKYNIDFLKNRKSTKEELTEELYNQVFPSSNLNLNENFKALYASTLRNTNKFFSCHFPNPLFLTDKAQTFAYAPIYVEK